MKRGSLSNPEQLSYRGACGWAVIVTVPIFILSAGFGLVMLGSMLMDGFVNLPVAGQVFGVLFALFLGYKIISLANYFFACIGMTADREAGVVSTGWGYFFPWWPTGTYPLRNFSDLMMDFMVIDHGRHKESWYVLYLTGSGCKVRIGRSSEYGPVRMMAEEVGKFLGMDVIDASSGTTVVLPKETLGMTLRDKVKVEGARSLPAAPAEMRSKYRVEDDRVIVEMPWLSSSGCLFVWLLLLAGLVALLSYIFIDSKGNWAPVAFFGAIGGFMLAVFYAAIAPRQTTLEVDPEALRVSRRGLLFTSRRNVPADRLREVRVDLLDVFAITDRGERISCGAHVPAAEKEWLRDLLQCVLAA